MFRTSNLSFSLVAMSLLAGIVVADAHLNANGQTTNVTNLTPGVEVDPVTGAVTTAVRIQVPPGRNGIEPEIAIRYNSSNSQNGVAGYGWTVDLGKIERLSNKGVPKYDATDEFLLLDGGRSDLVHIGGDLYRPEIESEFSKIEFVGGSHWVITSPNGTRRYYGQSASSRVADPSTPSRVFRYLLDRVEDVHGNYMVVTYTQGVGEDKHPLDILYTGSTNVAGGANPAPYAKVSFLYEASDRPDSSFSYLPGFRLDQKKRLDQVDVRLRSGELQRRYDLQYTLDPKVNKSYLTMIRELGSDGSTAAPDLSYEYSDINPDFHPEVNVVPGNAPPEAFRSGRVRMLDLNRDGCDDLVHSPADGSAWQWYQSDCSGGFLPPQAVLNSPDVVIQGAFFPNRDVKLQDFTGDGLIDVAYQDYSFGGPSAKLWVNTGQGGFAPPTTPSGLIVHKDAKYLDMNADGLVDVVYTEFPGVHGMPWYINFNLGGGTFNSTPVVVANAPGALNGGPFAPGGITAAYTLEYIDYNADGLIDVGVGDEFWANNGQDGFDPPGSDPTLPPDLFMASNLGLLYKVDLNGDGLIDYLKTVAEGVPLAFPVYSSRGDETFEKTNPIGNLAYSHGFMFFDLNGDGYQDALTSARDSFNEVWAFNVNDNGMGLLDSTPVTEHHPTLQFSNTILYGGPHEVDLVLADVNGDSRIDIVYGGDPDATGPLPLQYQVWLGRKDARSARGGVLVAVADASGVRTEFTYDAEPVRGRAGPTYGYSHHSFKMEAVSSRTVTVAVSGDQYVTTYDYSGGVWDEEDREFRGFAEFTETDDSGAYEVTRTHQDDRYKFRVYETSRYDAQGNLFSMAVNDWAHQSLQSGVDFVYLERADHYTFDGGSSGVRSAESFVYGGNPQYGNVTQHIEWGEVDLVTGVDVAEDKRTTQTQYGNNDSGVVYLVGAPQYSILTNHGGERVREEWLFYDGATVHTALPSKGLLTKERHWVAAGEEAETEYGHDAYGNVVSILDPEQNSTDRLYDSTWALLPTKVTNALGHETHTAYFGLDGVPLDSGSGAAGNFAQTESVTDSNGQAVHTSYDPLGRIVTEYGPLDSQLLPTTSYSYDLVTTPGQEHWRVTTERRVLSGQAETMTTYEFLDGLGRSLLMKTPMESAGTYSVTGQNQYDFRGSPLRSYAPFASGGPATSLISIDPSRPYTEFEYDALGRPIEITNPDGSYSSLTYDDWVVERIDENGHLSMEYHDAFGRVVKVEEYKGADGRGAPHYNAATFELYATTEMEHSAADEVVEVLGDDASLTSMNYDGLGRKVDIVEPNSGGTEHAYDLNGNMLSYETAKGHQITFGYDELDRNDSKSFPGTGLPTVTYDYDDPSVPYSLGRLVGISTAPGFGRAYEFDALGRISADTREIDGVDYRIERTYDALGRVKTLVYPDGYAVEYAYNDSGAVESLTAVAPATQVFVTDVDYDARGKITDVYYGNGVHTAYSYEAGNFRLARILTKKGATTLQDLSYGYDKSGNIVSIANALTAQTQLYVYDHLSRLVQATGNFCGGWCTQDFVYDELGNLREKDGLDYTYGEGGAGPHAVTSLSDGTVVTYDANGNVVRKNGAAGDYRYAYDRENRLIRVKKGGVILAEHVYDDEGTRVQSTVYQGLQMGAGSLGGGPGLGGGNSVRFVDDLFEKHLGSNGFGVKHLRLDGMLIASLESTGKLRFVHGDHLGGTNLLTDGSGVLRSRTEYAPFGEVVLEETFGGGSEEAYFGFTGHRFDDESKLLYMMARYYDPQLARFLSVDTIVPDEHNPQSLNRYSYVYNNPLRLEDPSGHVPNDFNRVLPGARVSCMTCHSQVFNPGGPGANGLALGPEAFRTDQTEQLMRDFVGALPLVSTVDDIAAIGSGEGLITGQAAAEGMFGVGIGLAGGVAGRAAGTAVKAVGEAAVAAGKAAAKAIGRGAQAAAERLRRLLSGAPGSRGYYPDRRLPRTKHGDPLPDVDAPHSQLGVGKDGTPQAREWLRDPSGRLVPSRDIDFGDHNFPDIHPNPHQHSLTPANPKLAPKGGMHRGDPAKLEYPK